MGRNILFAAGVMTLLLAAGTALADGKFCRGGPDSPSVPFQRALIAWDDGQETLVLQSQYSLPDASGRRELGWVVPVPSVPDLASMPADEADYFFAGLAQESRPDVWHYRTLACTVSAVILLVPFTIGLVQLWRDGAISGYMIWAAMLILAHSALLPPIPPVFILAPTLITSPLALIAIGSLLLPACGWMVQFLRYTHTYRSMALNVLFLLCAVLLLHPFGRVVTAGRSAGVTTLKAQQVGVYDARVVKADEPKALIEWLRDNDFGYRDADRDAFERYVERGWCFVVARVDTSEDASEDRTGFEGLVAPLMVRFKADAPYYPLAQTALTRQETEVVLYTLAEHKMSCGDRMELRFAGRVDKGWGDFARQWTSFKDVEPPSFFDGEVPSLHYLCQFRGTLTPSEMQTDLRLRRADDDEPHRESRWEW